VAFEGSEDFSGEGAFEGAVDGCECPAGGEVAVAVVAASLSRRTPRTFGCSAMMFARNVPSPPPTSTIVPYSKNGYMPSSGMSERLT